MKEKILYDLSRERLSSLVPPDTKTGVKMEICAISTKIINVDSNIGPREINFVSDGEKVWNFLKKLKFLIGMKAI